MVAASERVALVPSSNPMQSGLWPFVPSPRQLCLLREPEEKGDSDRELGPGSKSESHRVRCVPVFQQF